MREQKYFGTDGIRGRVGTAPISADWMLKLGFALGSILKEQNKGQHKVLVGKDTRVSGYMFESALEAGLASAGVDTYLLGPMPTPAIAYLTRTFQADAGIVISASHNPYYDNGVKFFSTDGFKFSDELELAIEKRLELPMVTVPSQDLGRAVRVNDAEGRYIEFCKSAFPPKMNLQGLKIVLDCANGATYHVAPSVFKELGATVYSIGTEPNGLNINERCGSTSPSRLAYAVKEHQANLGIAFDGDGDRCLMVDEHGDIVDGDELLFIIADWYHARKTLAGGVIGTVMTNYGFEIALKAKKIPFYRTKVGDRYVLQALQEKGWNLGGESSGHIICFDQNTTGDGIVSSLQVLAAMQTKGQSLSLLRKQLTKLPQVLLNVPVHSKIEAMQNADILGAVKMAEARLIQKGRVLIRPSGTEPVIRVMVEGEDQSLITEVANNLAQIVEGVMQVA